MPDGIARPQPAQGQLDLMGAGKAVSRARHSAFLIKQIEAGALADIAG